MPEELKPEEKKEGIFTERPEVKPATGPKVAIPKELIRKRRSPLLIFLIVVVLLVGLIALAQIFVFPVLKEKLKVPVPIKEIPTIKPTSPETPPITNLITDSDGDGLTDEEERNLGTDINSPDTDNDELFDYEEVKVYQTDPLKSDTDGDGYKDGQELKAGYDPKDPSPTARLFDLKKEIEELEE